MLLPLIAKTYFFTIKGFKALGNIEFTHMRVSSIKLWLFLSSVHYHIRRTFISAHDDEKPV